MPTKAALICVAAALLLAGCSKPGANSSVTSEGTPGTQAVDYHKLIVFPLSRDTTDPNYKAYTHAEMLCNESSTPAAAENNLWCGAVQKAKDCSFSFGFNPKFSNGPALAAYVEKHPSADCPPK